jgi:hypothetical protein
LWLPGHVAVHVLDLGLELSAVYGRFHLSSS